MAPCEVSCHRLKCLRPPIVSCRRVALMHGLHCVHSQTHLPLQNPTLCSALSKFYFKDDARLRCYTSNLEYVLHFWSCCKKRSDIFITTIRYDGFCQRNSLDYLDAVFKDIFWGKSSLTRAMHALYS